MYHIICVCNSGILGVQMANNNDRTKSNILDH